MPQTSNADIIYSSQGATVSWEGISSFVTGNLPGDVQLGFQAHQAGSFLTSSFTRSVTGGKRGGGYLQFKTLLTSQRVVWGQIPGNVISVGRFGSAHSSMNSGGFNPLYLAFEFKDSSQAGSPMRYGWAGLSLVNGNLFSGGDFPALTISAWAYDTTGAQIPMGTTAATPEPGTMALLALGALTLGARGVRSWRRNRASVS